MKKLYLLLGALCFLCSSSFSQQIIDLVQDINPNGGSRPYCLTAYSGKLYFSADDGTYGDELWVSDGTTAGTQMVQDINPSGASNPYYFTIYKGKLYFQAQNGTNGTHLWVTDGTTAGTQMIAPDSYSTPDPDVSVGIVYNNSLYFTANYNSNGRELYKVTDQTSSISENHLRTFKVYPNPASDELNITTERPTSFVLYNLTGKVVQSFAVNHQKEVSLANLEVGIYILKENDTGNTMKIVKR
jgi:ELWxxDGT repeat protein